VQGSHLLLDRPCPSYIYTESTDGRVMFFRPWHGKTLAGTTEIRTILDTYNHYFPDQPCTEKDILKTYCGLRVLPVADGTAFAASRETQIISSSIPAPYIAVYGGKLTTYRREAEKDLGVLSRHKPGHSIVDTSQIMLQTLLRRTC